ncbi:SPASM domain-containing protein [Emticicia oligotrophica]
MSQQRCIIIWDGLVVPCCFDKDVEYLINK